MSAPSLTIVDAIEAQVAAWRKMADSLDEKAKAERSRPDSLETFRAGLEARRDTFLMAADDMARIVEALA